MAEEVGPAAVVFFAFAAAAARERGVLALAEEEANLLRAGVGAVVVREIFVLLVVFGALLATNDDEPAAFVELAAEESVSVLLVRVLGVFASVLALGIFFGGFCQGLDAREAVGGDGDLLLACGLVTLGGGLFQGFTRSAVDEEPGAFGKRVGGDGAFLELCLAEEEAVGGEVLLAREGLIVLERGTLPAAFVPEDEALEDSFGWGETLRAGRVVLIVLALGVL